MHVYINCITFHDKIIVCVGSVDLKGKGEQKINLKKETKKIDYCLVKNLFSIFYTYRSKTKFTVVGPKSYCCSIPARWKSIAIYYR